MVVGAVSFTGEAAVVDEGDEGVHIRMIII